MKEIQNSLYKNVCKLLDKSRIEEWKYVEHDSRIYHHETNTHVKLMGFLKVSVSDNGYHDQIVDFGFFKNWAMCHKVSKFIRTYEKMGEDYKKQQEIEESQKKINVIDRNLQIFLKSAENKNNS